MQERILGVYRRLLDRYGEQGWWPIRGVYDPSHKRRPKTPRERFEISVGAILTQSTAWTNASRALDSLRRASALSRRRLLELDEERLAELVRSAGYFRQKARKLRCFAAYRGRIERERLLAVWGLGPETVDSILLYAHDMPVFVVDAYTRRIFARLGLVAPTASYAEVQDVFAGNLAPDPVLFNEYHALIVRHAKDHCRPRPRCEGCPVRRGCRFAGEDGRGSTSLRS
jgi:endonuclease-3 related protein